MRCERCGCENDNRATYCACCGLSFEVNRKKRRIEGVIVSLVLVLIVAGTALGCYVFINNTRGTVEDHGSESGSDAVECFYCGASDHEDKDHPQCEKCNSKYHTTEAHRDSAAQEPVGDSSKENEQPKNGNESGWGGLGSNTGTNKCEKCGAPNHTTENHPPCTVVGCGSKEHDVYGHDRACKVCGKLEHKTEEHPCDKCGKGGCTETKWCDKCKEHGHEKDDHCAICDSTDHTTNDHPKCSTCGSSDHTTNDHPKCDVCGSTAHTQHPCDKCKKPDCDKTDWCETCETHEHDESDCPKRRSDKPVNDIRNALVPNLY